MNTNDRTPAAALSPALLAAVAALASVASWCTGIRSAPASVQFLLPGVWPVLGELAAALAEPTPAAFDALGAELARWCRIVGDAGMHHGDPAAFDLVMRAEDARGRVIATGIAARDGAAGVYDYDASPAGVSDVHDATAP